MNLAYCLLTFFAGLIITVQVGVNSTLREWLANPVMASMVSFVVGLTGLIAYALLTRESIPPRAAFFAAPWWAWTGGLLGAFYVVTTVIVGPRLGAATTVSLVVLGQLVASLLLDHYGWLGFPQHSVSLVRFTGALLLFGGVWLIMR